MHIVGWKRLETPDLVNKSPSLVLKKLLFNLISGLYTYCPAFADKSKGGVVAGAGVGRGVLVAARWRIRHMEL